MYFRDEMILPKAMFPTGRHVLTLTRIATVSVPIVAETCARRGAGFSRFLQLVPGEGESQTAGKLCVLHFLCQAFDTTLFSSGWPIVTRSTLWRFALQILLMEIVFRQSRHPGQLTW